MIKTKRTHQSGLTHESEMPVDDFILTTGRLPREEATGIAALVDFLPSKFDV